MRWFVLAPGPSMSADLAERVRGNGYVCVVNNVYQLAPWADVLVANDVSWWLGHKDAHRFQGRKFSTNRINGVEIALPNTFRTSQNSGCLALDVVRNLGATEVVMLGFDMHGTHFFGTYTNGCRNTSPARRRVHFHQFEEWRRRNPELRVVNCTEGSALTCFPMARIEDELAKRQGSGDPVVREGVRDPEVRDGGSQAA